MKFTFPNRRRVAVLGALMMIALLLIPAASLLGATRTWSGNGGDNFWSTAANWGGIAPAAGDSLFFPGGVDASSLKNTNNFATNTAFTSLIISGTNYTLVGNPIILSNGIIHTSGGTNNLSFGLQLNANQQFQVSVTSAQLTVGNINLNGHSLTNDATGRIHLVNALSGTGSVIKNGPGTLRFFGSVANTYAGSTRVNDGVLELAKSASATCVPGALFIGDGVGALNSAVVRSLQTAQISVTSAVTIEDDGLLDLNNASELIGPLTLAGGDVTTGTGTLTLGGDVTVLTSTNGATISGNLSLGSSTRTFDTTFSAAPIELSIAAQISGTGGIIKNGAGEMILSGSNSFTGTVTANAGRLYLYNNSALGSTNAGTLIQSNATLALNAEIGLEPLTLDSTGAATSGSSLAAFAGTGSNSWTGNIILLRDSTIRVDTSQIINLGGSISGPGGITKIGEGTLRFSGGSRNTYAGTTHVHDGVLTLAKTVTSGAVTNDLVIGDGLGGANDDVVILQNGLQLSDKTDVIITNSGQLLIPNPSQNHYIGSLAGSGNVVLAATIDFETGNNDASTIFSGIISGSSGLRKYGSGTMTLSGNNTYTAATSINEGTLIVNGSQPQSGVNFSGGGTLGGTGTVGNITGSGSIAPGASPGVLTCSNVAFGGSFQDFIVELNGTTAGTGYDQLNVRGTNNLAGTRLKVFLNFPSSLSNQFVIINNDGAEPITGTFAGLPQNATLTAGGQQFRISYTGGDGNDVVLTQINVLRPALTIERASTNAIRLLWQTNDTAGFALQFNTNLNTTNWTLASPPPVVVGPNNVVTNSLIGTQRFYRLVKP